MTDYLRYLMEIGESYSLISSVFTYYFCLIDAGLAIFITFYLTIEDYYCTFNLLLLSNVFTQASVPDFFSFLTYLSILTLV